MAVAVSLVLLELPIPWVNVTVGIVPGVMLEPTLNARVEPPPIWLPELEPTAVN